MNELRSCPACFGERIEPWFSSPTTRRPDGPETWHVWRCADCLHGFMNPQPTWDELAPYYASDYGPYATDHAATDLDDEAATQRARRDGLLRHVPVSDGLRILDFGCGGGWFLRIANRLGARGVGVEPSSVGVARARESGLEVFEGTLDQFLESGWDGEPFDLVTANHVLEHTPEPEDTLTRLRSLVSPAGTIWLAVPNAQSWAFSRLRAQWYSVDVPYHLHHFVPQSLELVAERAGLKVRRRSTHSLPRALAASFALYLRHRYLLPRTLTTKLGVDRWLTGRFGPQFDGQDRGEAIHLELGR